MWMWVKYSKLDLPLTGFHGSQDSIIIWLPGIRKHLAFQWWHSAFTTVSRYPRTDHSQQPWTALPSLLPIQSNVAISLAFHGAASPVADHLFALHVSQWQNTNTASSFPGYPALQEICGCYGRKYGIVIILPAANICFINVNFTLPCSVTRLLLSRGFFFFRAERATFFSEFWRETQIGGLKCFFSIFTSAYLQPNSRHKYPGRTRTKEHEDNGSIRVQVHPRARSPFLRTVAPSDCEMYIQDLTQAKWVARKQWNAPWAPWPYTTYHCSVTSTLQSTHPQ